MARAQAFDAGLIGLGGVVAPEAGTITLLDHPDERVVVVSYAFDLNVPVMVEHGGLTGSYPVTEGEEANLSVGLVS